MILELEGIEYREQERLSGYCTFKVGGMGRLLIFPKDKDEIKKALAYCKNSNMRYMIIGNGSNILFSDEGFDGALIKIGRKMSRIDIEGEYIYAEAGILLSQLAARAAEKSLTGLEFAAGIPGTLGGAVCMNAGAYGGEMKDVIVSVDILEDGELKTYSNEELKLSYRHSIITENPELIVLGARLKLAIGDEQAIRERMRELANARSSKQPLEYPSAGSTFKRPEGYYAGKLIEDSGLKGYRVGGACVSEKHCGFVVNDRNATANDIKQLIKDVQDKVYREFGVRLETEVKIV